MLRQITMLESLKYTSPHPVSLICVQTPEGKTNLTTVSWWTYLENDPAYIGFSIWNKSYTCEVLLKCGKAVLSIPSAAIAEETLKCGSVSGRVVDKVKDFAIDLIEAPVKYPVHSRLAFICGVEKNIKIGDCIFFICKVDDVYCNEDEKQIFAWSGYGKLAPIETPTFFSENE
ncbi:MAG: flavin reductase family protein [Candidatus Cloacimonetes bacterium]|nr:flavin reductase family protein [Candidatus Cloacimonadota bacterium]